MTDYLCPNSTLTVQEQNDNFQIRSMANPLPSNRGNPDTCSTDCGDSIDNPHVLHCPDLSTEVKEYIVNGTIEEIKSDLTKLRENMEKFEYFKSMDSV